MGATRSFGPVAAPLSICRGPHDRPYPLDPPRSDPHPPHYNRVRRRHAHHNAKKTTYNLPYDSRWPTRTPPNGRATVLRQQRHLSRPLRSPASRMKTPSWLQPSKPVSGRPVRRSRVRQSRAPDRDRPHRRESHHPRSTSKRQIPTPSCPLHRLRHTGRTGSTRSRRSMIGRPLPGLISSRPSPMPLVGIVRCRSLCSLRLLTVRQNFCSK